ncbi:MAG: recombinase family protein, partial [Myxococcales bacterium]|nr:recombinase family protein [Myxococcales bacterium]
LEQATGTSLRDQQAAIEAHAAARGVVLAHVYVEAESGIHENNERREQMQALLRDVRRGVAHRIVHRAAWKHVA